MGWLRLALRKGHLTNQQSPIPTPGPLLAPPNWCWRAQHGQDRLGGDSSLAQCPDIYNLDSQGYRKSLRCPHEAYW